MAELYVKKMTENVYLLDEDHAATGYLVVGSEKACVIDTMNGACDLYEEVRKLTDKPLVVVNTHGHPDHIFGNRFFFFFFFCNDRVTFLKRVHLGGYCKGLRS